LKSWEAKIKTIECPICKRTWEEGCQQETIIKTHGSCAVCRYDEKPPEGMNLERCFKETDDPTDTTLEQNRAQRLAENSSVKRIGVKVISI